MALSAQTYQGDGTNTDFVLDFTLGYISTAHIYVFVDEEEIPQNTLQFILGGGSVRLPNPPADGAKVLVRRIVPNDALIHDYEDGALVIEKNLDESNLQAVMLQHQAQDGFATDEGRQGNLNMGTYKVVNSAPGETSGELVEYDQFIEGLSNLASVGIIPRVQPRQQGDGTTTTFTTPSDKARLAQSFFIHLDGLSQRPYTDFLINLDGTVKFDEAPAKGVDIDIVLFEPANVQQVVDSSTVLATGTTTPRSLADRFADIYNLKDFGVVGDGMTDDTEAIKLAMSTAAAASKRLVVPAGRYYITELLILPAQCWLEGELHFFRTNGIASEFVVKDDHSGIQLQDYTLGHRIENILVVYEGATPSTLPGIINQTIGLMNNTTASMGAHFENVYTRGFYTGFHVKAWAWQQRYINCWSEQHVKNGFFVQGDDTAAALLQFDHCSAITGSIADGAVGIHVEGGNVILDNCRWENNATGIRAGYDGDIAPDSTGAAITINNGYFEGNRTRDIECLYGSSITADYVQCIHQNTGHTTNTILFSTGDVSNGGSIIIQRLVVKANNGNDLQYLTLNEDNSHIWVNDCEFLDLENSVSISPYFNGRYAPAYIGFREHDFEVHSLGLNWQYEFKRIQRTNTTGWEPRIATIGTDFVVAGGERYVQYDSVDRLMYGDIATGNWYYKDYNLRPVEFQSTPNISGDVYSMKERSGLIAVRYTGNPSTATFTIDDTTMDIGDVFFVTDALVNGEGNLSSTLTINIGAATYTNNPLETTFFKKIKSGGGSTAERIISWKG